MSKLPVRLDVNAILSPSGERLAQPSTAGVLMPAPLPGRLARFAGSDQSPNGGIPAAGVASSAVTSSAAFAHELNLRILPSCVRGQKLTAPATPNGCAARNPSGMMES